MDTRSGHWAEIQDLERLRDWLIALGQGQPSALDPQRAQRWQGDLKAPGERLAQLFF